MTGLSTFAACLGGKLWILRKAALLIGHALAALTARDGRELSILRKTALRARDALAAFAACLGGQTPVLREAALLVRDGLTAHACYLPLALLIHRRESAVRRAAILSWYVSHYYSPTQ
jgi:hypothetical protein